MTVSDRATLMGVGLGGPSVEACAWPRGTVFTFRDEPGEHDPCYVVLPDGALLPVNHHAAPGVDIARAKYIITACNAARRATVARPSQPVDLDTRIKEVAIALAVATVASCDCDTKSPAPELHSSECTYASLRMAMARVDRIIARRPSPATPIGGLSLGVEGDQGVSRANSGGTAQAPKSDSEGGH